jgi:hypothetical protein
MLAADDR